MRNKWYWGLAAFIILLGTAFIVITIRDRAEIQQPKEQAAETDTLLEEKDKRNAPEVVEGRQPLQGASPDGHWHDGVWHNESHDTPIAQNVPVSQPNETQTYDGPLTYHAELLKTNPVKALRLQAEERGHWSKDHIPPFPPDDTEAQEFARNTYLTHYYLSIDDESNSIHGKAARAYLSQLLTIDEYPSGARKSDLLRITWTILDSGEVIPYGGMTRYGRARMRPSDYFPDFIGVPK